MTVQRGMIDAERLLQTLFECLPGISGTVVAECGEGGVRLVDQPLGDDQSGLRLVQLPGTGSKKMTSKVYDIDVKRLSLMESALRK